MRIFFINFSGGDAATGFTASRDKNTFYSFSYSFWEEKIIFIIFLWCRRFPHPEI